MPQWLSQWWPAVTVGIVVLMLVGTVVMVNRLARSPAFKSGFETVFRRRMVQPIITHIMAWTFAILAAAMILCFLLVQEYDRAEDVFTYIVAVVGPIVGFWFGARAREGEGHEGGKVDPMEE